MHYEEMTKAAKIRYSIIAWVLLVTMAGGIWFLYFGSRFHIPDIVENVLGDAAWIVMVCFRALMVVLTAVLITGISETMTRIKRHLSERVMCTALCLIMLLSLNVESAPLFVTATIYRYLYAMLAVLLFIWPYLREIPYDCFGSREPWFLITIWIIPVGFVAGFGNRAVGLVMVAFAIATIIYVNKVSHRVFAWMPIGAVSAFLGAVARFLLPIYYTKNYMSPIEVYKEAAAPYLNLGGLLSCLFYYLLPAILVTFAIVAVTKGAHNVALGREIVYVLTTAVVVSLCSAMIPQRSDESMYPAIVLFVLAYAAMSLKLFEKRPAMKKYFYMGCGFFLFRLVAFFVMLAL